MSATPHEGRGVRPRILLRSASAFSSHLEPVCALLVSGPRALWLPGPAHQEPEHPERHLPVGLALASREALGSLRLAAWASARVEQLPAHYLLPDWSQAVRLERSQEQRL